jgi:type II secretory pathway pseudopilin PulG
MLKPQRRLQLGLTLIELMISIVLSLFVLGGVLYITSSTMQANTQALRSTHLNQELRAAMQMITRDIRRAGYRYGVEIAGVYTASNSVTIAPLSGNSIVVTAPASAPFGEWIIGSRIRHVSASTGLSYCIDISSPTSGTSFTSATGAFVDCEDSSNPTAFPSASIGAGSWTIEDPNGGIQFTANCVSSGYDFDDDDVGDGVITAPEVIGYRLNGTAIERGSSADCSTNTLSAIEAIISPAISGVTITNFSVTNLGPAAPIPAGNVDVQLLELQLTLSGQLSSDTSVTRSITEVVKVRNDQLI